MEHGTRVRATGRWKFGGPAASRRPGADLLVPTVFLVALSIGSPTAAGAQVPPTGLAQADTVRLPDTAVGRAFPVFLRAYNRGRLDSLRAFAERHVRSVGERIPPASFARYWLGIYREYGPVWLSSVDTTESPPYFWVRGRVTRGWALFRFWFTPEPPHRLTGYGVGRGLRPPTAPGSPPVAGAELERRLDIYLDEVASADFFAGVVLVARGGERVFERAYGLTDRRHRVPNRTDTRFLIASLGKMFTAVATLQLIEEGRLALEDRLEEHVPEYPGSIGSRVTIRHLLTHTSGIELDDYAPYNRDVSEARTVGELLEAQLRHIDHLNEGTVESFEPPGIFDYTNEGYDLLAVIIERVSGTSWERYLRERVLGPAGMERTGFHHDVPVSDLATGYTRGGDHPEGERRENHALVSLYARPAGGMYSTASDLFRFVNALRSRELLGAEFGRAAVRPQVEWDGRGAYRGSYGFGFEIEEVDGVLHFGHSGSQPGVAARVRVYPELGYTTIVLSNHDNAARNVTDHIRELISGL